MVIPKDVAELLQIHSGDVLAITANADGWFKAEKADSAGAGA